MDNFTLNCTLPLLMWWCESCKEWKKKIFTHVQPKGRKIYWDKTLSWKWPGNYRELGKVFAHQHWEEGKLNDVPTYLRILESCDAFGLSPSVLDQIKKIREARNDYIGHNASLELSDSDKTRIFTMLKQFVSENEIAQGVNAPSLIQTFHNIEKGEKFQNNREIVNSIRRIEVQIQVANSQEDANFHLQTVSRDVAILENDIRGTTIACYRMNVATNRTNRKFRCTSVWIYTVLNLLLVFLFPWTGKDTMPGCLSEDISHRLQPGIYMSHYIHEHRKLVGRQWLLQNISETILNENFDHTGVLLVADMGFGKSALVSHIVCADSDQAGAKLRAKLLAYHICRFDAFNTKRVDLFIRRLAGMIANSIPQFEFVLETECNYDPVGCMDQSILFPLSKIEWSIDKKQRFIIIIDGLDECEDTENSRNEILSVLQRTAYRFPAWIKFICTTRNIPSIINKMGDFHVIQPSANDIRNGKDIYEFIDRYLEEHETIETKLLNSWMFDVKMDVINKLADMTAGNFLYVQHALRFLKLKDILSIKNVPTSLDKIYQLNFERVYGKRGEGFQFAEKVLEVLSASKDPMKKESIFKIINFEYKHLNRDVYDKEMHSLNHFVTTTADDCVFFTHISIYHWLIHTNRKGALFYINKENGHYFIAKYLLSSVKEKNKSSIKHIIDIVVHVAESKREDLVEEFKSLPPEIFNNKSISTSLLHTLAGQINSYLATELCLHFVKKVDSRNEDDVTPAFIAAGKGNVYTLQALLYSGADISFHRQLPAIKGYLEDPVFITKTRTFWGYGLLDIAAQYGHVDIIHLLLTRNISLADVVNEMNVRPHHLACEFGHIKVLDAFLTFGPQFADQRCLYNAASHGHKQIVQDLLHLDVKDICVPCNGSFYWVRENENRLQAEYLTPGIPNNVLGKINLEPKRKPFDDWWTISCETALHAASRNGFADIAQLLVSRKQNAMSCRDRAGRTPFLTAVIYNRTETTRVLYPMANLSDRCVERGLTDDELAQLSKLEIQKLSEGKCLNGLSVVHLLARYGLANLASSFPFDWEEEDNEGNRPIHHAACHSDIDMINTLSKFLHVDLFSRTRNGSTAFHLAALCRPFNLIWLHDTNVGRLPLLYDVMNRSILQYMYSSPLRSTPADGIQLDKDRRDLMDYLFSAEDITHFDSSDANVLHSVIGNGYFLSMINMYLKYQDDFLRLIMRNNSFNRTPLDEAFCNVPNENFVVAKAHDSSIDQTLLEGFRNISEGNFLNNISPVEQSIIYLVRIISQHTEHHQFFAKYVHDAIRKSNVYLTRTFLLYMKAYDVLDYRGYSPLHTFMSIGNNPFMAEIFLANSSDIIKCRLPLEKSPLHQTALNINNSFWFITTEKMNELLKGVTPAYLEQCFDAEGYNILQRAAEGGNFELSEYFIDRGLFSTENDNLIFDYMILGAAAKWSFYKPILQHYELRLYYGPNNWHIEPQTIHLKTNYDLTLLLFLRKFNEVGYLSYHHICNTSTATLSLVHLAAANGLKESLEYINDNWGKQALSCNNIDLISPLYLSHIFHQHETIQYIKKQNISLHFPKLQTEVILAVILFNDIDNMHHENLNCLKGILRFYRQINDYPRNYFALFRYLKGLPCSRLLPLSIFNLTSLQSTSAHAFVVFSNGFSRLHEKRRHFNDFIYAKRLQDISKIVYKLYKKDLVPFIKGIFSAIFANEICYLESRFISDWFFNHLLNNMSKLKKFDRFSLYVYIFLSIIDQTSHNSFTPLNILRKIGGYREMETSKDSLNITITAKQRIRQIFFSVPKVLPEAFPPLKAFSKVSDGQKNKVKQYL